MVEAGTAVLFVALAIRFPVGSEAAWALPAYLYFGGLVVVLTVIDLANRRLPDAIVLPSYPVAALLLVAASWGLGDWSALVRGLVGGVILWTVYFLLMVVRPGGMGFGDVKLAGLIGIYLGWLGWGALVVGAFAAFLLGGLFAVVLLVARRAGRSSRIPFGPWMLLGAVIGVGVGEAAWAAYLDLIG
jgi:leader peptidase (prepilin peptidase)/N-methyltransferase